MLRKYLCSHMAEYAASNVLLGRVGKAQPAPLAAHYAVLRRERPFAAAPR